MEFRFGMSGADGNSELGPVYGTQWRNWPAPDEKDIDQIENIIRTIKNSPDARRIIISVWNVAEVDQMALLFLFTDRLISLKRQDLTKLVHNGTEWLSCNLY